MTGLATSLALVSAALDCPRITPLALLELAGTARMRNRFGDEAARHAISAARANANVNAAVRKIPVGIVSCSERVSPHCLFSPAYIACLRGVFEFLFSYYLHRSSSTRPSFSCRIHSPAYLFHCAYTHPIITTVHHILRQPHLPLRSPSAHICALFSALPPLHFLIRFARSPIQYIMCTLLTLIHSLHLPRAIT